MCRERRRFKVEFVGAPTNEVSLLRPERAETGGRAQVGPQAAVKPPDSHLFLGPSENSFDGLRKPSPRCLGGGCGRKLLDDNEAVDLTAQESIEKAGIVPEGHAS